LRQAARHVSQIYDRHMAQVGLRGTQYSILSKLDRVGPMSLGRLAEIMVMERTALSRAIGPLQRDGLVSVGAGRRKNSKRPSALMRRKLCVPRSGASSHQRDAVRIKLL